MLQCLIIHSFKQFESHPKMNSNHVSHSADPIQFKLLVVRITIIQLYTRGAYTFIYFYQLYN